MLKYVKYEIKGTYRYILGILALVLILFTFLYSYIFEAAEKSGLGAFFLVLVIFILFGAALTAFLYIVGSFRKELYEDSGYLTFTLPLTGRQIVGAKLIVALIWFFILGGVIGLYNLIMIFVFSPVDMSLSQFLGNLVEEVSLREWIFLILSLLMTGVTFLLLIYFSMALSRITFRNKKIGSLWFIIFLILLGLLTYVQIELASSFPYYLDLDTFQVKTMHLLNDSFFVEVNTGVLHTDFNLLSINLASDFFTIISAVALFLGTGYLIERKIDL